jgi:myo-inositol 2-dehydrogenase / D-chiro-inositol 1-dehydrogenase
MFDIALFGAGRIGRIHARNVSAHPALRLKYLVDPFAADAQNLAEQTGATLTAAEEVWSDPDVAGVIIASPTPEHLEQCLRAVETGKAVLCEKPLDLDLERARAAHGRLTAPDVRLLLGFNRRFDPNFATLQSRLQSGTVGTLESLQITSHDPAPPPVAYVRTSGGLFKDMAIHDFDMARWLLGEEPVEVYASASCLVDPAIGAAGDIDTAKTLLKTASGRLCVISNSRRSGYGYDQRIEAFGSGGLVRADNLLESSVSVWAAGGMASDAFQNFFLDRYAEAYRRELAHFAAVVAGEARPAVGYSDAVAALALAEAAGASVRSGLMVRVP